MVFRTSNLIKPRHTFRHSRCSNRHVRIQVIISKGVYKVLMGLIFSPLIGFILSILLMYLLMWLFKRSTPSFVSNIFGRLQIVSAAYMAFSHGSNDAQKTMGIITMALVSYYHLPDFHVPIWVIISALLRWLLVPPPEAGGSSRPLV